MHRGFEEDVPNTIKCIYGLASLNAALTRDCPPNTVITSGMMH